MKRRLVALGGAVLAPLLAVSAAAASLRVALDEERVATLSEGELYLEALPQPREGLLAFAERFCGTPERAPLIAAANAGAQRLMRGVRYRVPFRCLDVVHRELVLTALFPDDLPSTEGWRHRVRRRVAGRDETLWAIAEWFTGKGESYREIRDHNGLPDETVAVGQELVVPSHLLLPPFAEQVAPLARTSGESLLSYHRDELGEYASYRLRPGEALYSSVVVRFTGRLFAADVNPLAELIAERSGIADVTDIPVGYGVKIPFDDLSPEFLPPGHPRRREYEASRSASRQYINQVRAVGLESVAVILDAGHGGKDSGAQNSGVWESLYVYDIMLRVRELLEERTAATVYTTTRDGDSFRIEERDLLSRSQQHVVLTTPPYAIETAQVGTHLRWYLANDLLARQRRIGVDPEEVVFISIHADSLHPSVRGAMVYVPGLLPIPKSYGKAGAVYSSRVEVRNHPRVSFTKGERVRSEGLSRDLAGHLIAGLARQGLAIHPNQPVRDRIVRRRGQPWVPAVLRYNAVPAKVLVEVCNLSNPDDLRLVKTRRFRQQVAQAIVDGLLTYYGHTPGGARQVAEVGD